MLVKQEQLNPCEVELHIEIESDKVQAAVDKAYSDLGKSVNIPGFRKGKAPKVILEQFLDEERVKERAAEQLLQKAYVEALEESKVEPFAMADVDITKFELGEPLTFLAKVPLAPKVELGTYKGIKAERRIPNVTDEEVEIEIDNMRKRQASFPEVEGRAAQKDDVVRVETRAENEPDEKPKGNVFKIGGNLPEFDQGLIGMNIDEEKVIDVTYPDEHPDETLRGQTVPMRIWLREIREEKLPELNDEWVKGLFGAQEVEGEEASSEVVDTVAKLKEKFRESMEGAAKDVAKEQVQMEILEEVIKGSQIHFPDVMVDEAVDERLNELAEELKERKLTLDDYIKYKNTSLDDLRGEYAEQSKKAITATLVLREIVDKENIQVEEDDIEAEYQRLSEANKVPVESIKAYAEKTNGISAIKNRILRKKVIEFLVESSNIKDVG